MLSSSEGRGDIADWLFSIHLEQYTNHFRQSGYFTVEDCQHMNNEILLQIGIGPTGHRKRILKHLNSVFPEADATTVSKSPETGDTDLESENQVLGFHSPPKIEPGRSVPASKLRTNFVKGNFTSDCIDPVSIDGCIQSKNKIPSSQMQRVEVEQKFPVGKNLKVDAFEPDEACFNFCDPQGDVDSRPPVPPRLHQGTPPLKFTPDRMPLPSASVDSSNIYLKEHSTSAEMQHLIGTPPDSPFFEFQGEMVQNDLYVGHLGNVEQVTSFPVTASDLRNRPVPQLPDVCAAMLDSTDISSLLKRRNLKLSHVSTCDVPQKLLLAADENKPSPITPYGEMYLYHSPEDDQEILNRHLLHGIETSTRAISDQETNNELRTHHGAKLCDNNKVEQVLSQSDHHIVGEDPEMEYSTISDSTCKQKFTVQAVSRDYCKLQAPSKQSFVKTENCSLLPNATGECICDAGHNEHDPISPYACFYGVPKKTKEGWLDKLSPQGNCVFQKRWVKFDGENLSYYNNEKEMYSKGIIPLPSIIRVQELGDNKFEVVSSTRTFTFRVEKEGDREDWMDTLLTALRSQSNTFSQLNSRCAVTADKFGYLELRGYKARIFVVLRGSIIWLYKSEQDFKSGIGITMVNTNVATVKDVDRKSFELSTPFRNFSFTAESEREKQEWIEAMRGSIAESLSDYEVAEKIWFNESNRNCADCRAPDPEWASINLGVVVCKKCAGQHRSLGSNISKIRSLKLDTSIWSNELVEFFIVVGNKTANAFWAANLKAGEELDMDAPPNYRLEFITQKYKEGKFRRKLSPFLNQEELNKALCQAVVTQDILETMSLVFSGADVMCATGEPTYCTPYLLAQKAGQRLQMEFLFHNKLSVLPKIDELSKAGILSNNSQSSFLCGFLYKAMNTTKTVTEKRSKEDFQKRWCTLEGGFLSYYESDKSATPNGRIDINEVVCLGVAKSDFTWGAGVSSTFEMYLLSERVFSFGTDNVEILKDWTRAISKFLVPAVAEILLKRDYELIGRLYYKDVHNLEHWKAGWFALEKSQLCFFPEQGQIVEEDSVHLKRLQELTVSTEIEKPSEKRAVLLLVEKGRTLYIHGHTKLDFTAWHTAIRKAAGTDGNALRDQQLSRNDIPIIVDSCIAFVTQYGLGSEAIYQKGGTPARVNLLLDQFRKDARNVKLRIGEHQLGDVTDAMKRFLFEIDDALLTKELYPYWLSALDVQNENERLEKYRMLIQTLPRVNRVTLAALIGHLYRVQKCSKMNQMNTHSLSQVFSPYLFQTEGQTKQEVNVVEDLINLYVQLFGVNEDQVKQMEIENSFITTWKDTQVAQAGDLIIEVYLGKKDPDCCCIIRVSPTMTAEELTSIILEMKNIVTDEKVLWTTFEVIENGELERVLHYKENVLEQVLQWSTLPEPESAYLIIKQFQAAKAIKKYLVKNIKDSVKTGILKWREEPSRLLSGNKFQERYFVLQDEKLFLYKDAKSNKTEREVVVKSLKLYLGLKKKLKPPTSLGFTLYSEKQQWYLCCDKEEAYVEWLASLLNAQHEGDLWRLDGKLHVSSAMLNAKLSNMGLMPGQKKIDGRKMEQTHDCSKLKLNDALQQTFHEGTQGRPHHLVACQLHSEVQPENGQEPNRPTLRPGQINVTQNNTKLKRNQGPQISGQTEGSLSKMVFGTDAKLHSELMQELNTVFLKSNPLVKNE